MFLLLAERRPKFPPFSQFIYLLYFFTKHKRFISTQRLLSWVTALPASPAASPAPAPGFTGGVHVLGVPHRRPHHQPRLAAKPDCLSAVSPSLVSQVEHPFQSTVEGACPIDVPLSLAIVQWALIWTLVGGSGAWLLFEHGLSVVGRCLTGAGVTFASLGVTRMGWGAVPSVEGLTRGWSKI